MRSPFPGMDPYLEDQGRWPDFHASTITYCCDALNDCLPDDYVAQMGEEVRVDEVRDTWIEIRRLPDERLVTMIETLWPRNKGLSGLTDYLEKLHRLRTQGVNLVEIDLLIAGRRLPMAKPLLPGHFFAIVCRASKSETGDVYAWLLQQPLPKIPIPLEDPDPDVFLDLAEVFALAYQRGRYASLLNYNRPLDLPLHPQDKEWAEKVARGKDPS
ncbi:MAG: DUF4058 family protein [Isosphaeraceae bacterium]